MLAAARAAIAAAQTAQAGGMPPPGAPQPDLSGIAERVAGSPVALPDFAPGGVPTPSAGGRDIDLLGDASTWNVKIELGRTRMLVEDVLRLGEGSVVELDKLRATRRCVRERSVMSPGAGPVVNDNFCVRISEILSRVPGSDD